MISGRSGLLTVSSLKAKTGRRLAKPPSAARSPSRPASGRLLVGRESNLSSPTAPKNTASESSAAASVSAGQGCAVLFNGYAADALIVELQRVAAGLRCLLQHRDALLGDFRADAVSGRNQNLQFHSCLPLLIFNY